MSDRQSNLENVYWLGGSPCAGKSALSNLLASRFDLNVYHVDEAFAGHALHLHPDLHPALTQWEMSSWNERWMRPVDRLVESVIACYREHFSLILEEILSLHKNKALLVEGSALLPVQVAGVLRRRNRAIWVVPTIDFQIEHYSRRAWVIGVLGQCEDGQAAFQNWMERDRRFADWVIAEVTALGLEFIRVDGRRTVEENAMAVASHFQLLAN